MRLEIVKAHGASNDFVMIEDMEDNLDLEDDLVVRLCDRRRGVGADGVIRVVQGPEGLVLMDHRNADGSRPEMCGNGVRCFAKFCFDRGILAGTESTVMTRSGPREVHVHHDAKGKVCRVEVEMGSASFSPSRIPVEADPEQDFLDIRLDGVAQRAYFANIGNPHAVVYVDDPEVTPVDVWGPAVETDVRFPNGANASFVSILDRNRVEARVWERGVGETMACGTAACAIAAVSRRLGHVDSAVDVALPGGDLHVFLGETLILGGPAVEVFTATVDTRSLGT